jgi:hypothetical protein
VRTKYPSNYKVEPVSEIKIKEHWNPAWYQVGSGILCYLSKGTTKLPSVCIVVQICGVETSDTG